jgi:hypothetical protein
MAVVTVKNNSGQTVKLTLDDSEGSRDAELIDQLRKMARREDLDTVSVSGSSEPDPDVEALADPAVVVVLKDPSAPGVTPEDPEALKAAESPKIEAEPAVVPADQTVEPEPVIEPEPAVPAKSVAKAASKPAK